ncbi:hypothetical protein Tco_1151921 [Tanacetum coccineum]
MVRYDDDDDGMMLVVTLMEMWQRGWGCGDSGATVAGGGEGVEARGGGDQIDPGRIYLFIILGLAGKVFWRWHDDGTAAVTGIRLEKMTGGEGER